MIWLLVTDEFGCTATDTINISISTGTGLTVHSLETIRIIPNPSTGIIRISGITGTDPVIEVYSTNGTLVYETSVVRDPELDLSFLPEGIYTIKLIRDRFTTYRKIILY